MPNQRHLPPTYRDLLLRKASSLALIGLLLLAATPFRPFSWLISLDDSFLIDRLLAGVILTCACYFQWRVASLSSPVLVALPFSDAATPVWVWRPSDYWAAAAAEFALLFVAEFGPSEFLRRSIVLAVVAALWMVGWAATPEGLKRWAWEQIKVHLLFLLLDEMRGVGYGARRPGARRGRARW